MNKNNENRNKILIADDSEMNRSILVDILGDEFDIMEAEDGTEAVAMMRTYGGEIDLLLLDIVMPEMDGFEVLSVMNKYHWIEDIPVIMISAENASTYVEQAYEMGVTDYISRPFDALVVHRRVINTIMLYSKQKKLIGMVADQMYEKEKSNSTMIAILSHIVEFRNGESGLHVIHINAITEILLKALTHKTDAYRLTYGDISLISTASALHDIGKIAIPEHILNKPGRFTPEEFAIMKTHSMHGASMLEHLSLYQNDDLVQVAYQICRWHHERYDGRGYPDGLKGEEIPIAAQVVSLADVYDALTSERVYKKAYSHETALQMILNGECGAFNPILLECLQDAAEDIREAMKDTAGEKRDRKETRKYVEKLVRHNELAASERTLRLLEHERMKYQFFVSMSDEITFEYTTDPKMLTISDWGAARYDLKEIIMDPVNDAGLLSVISKEDLEEVNKELRQTTPETPIVKYNCKLRLNGEERWNRLICRAMWSSEEPPRYTGAIGKAVDIHEAQTQLSDLKRKASHDSLTGLLNHAYAKECICTRLQEEPDGKFALAIFDLDFFKLVNDNYGHKFGDDVLKFVGEHLHHSVRKDDIASRIGGDEFMLFLRYQSNLESIMKRIYSSLNCTYKGLEISLSMGVALTEQVGRNYEDLFMYADQALYAAKSDGRGRYHFHVDSMKSFQSPLTPFDECSESEGQQETGQKSDTEQKTTPEATETKTK